MPREEMGGSTPEGAPEAADAPEMPDVPVGPDSTAGARTPSGGPAQAAASGWRAAAADFKARIVRDRVSVSAGSLAYHGFLAFFPAIIAALGVLSLVHVGAATLHQLTHGIARALPSGGANVFEAAVRAATSRRQTSIVAAVVGILVAVWSTSSAMAVLQQTLDVAYEVRVDRAFFARRLRGMPLLVLTAVLGGAAAVLIVFGQPIGSAIRSALPIPGAVFTVGWTAARWAVALALISVLFGALYYLGPNREEPRWRWFTPGSLLATVVFVAASLGFSFYVSTFGQYGKTYGSFAGVAIFVFWLYLVAMAVLLGGELNAVLENQAARAGSRSPWHPFGRNGAAAGLEPGGVPGTASAGERPAQTSEPRRVSG